MRVAHRLLLAVALLCSAPVAAPDDPPARTGEAARPPSTRDAGTSARPSAPAPSRPAAGDQRAPSARVRTPRYRRVQAGRVAIRADQVAGPRVAARARRVDGVVQATTVRIGRSRVGAGADAPTLTVAAVDPVAYRPFAPQVVADEVRVWQRLDHGELAVTHEHADRLGLQLGKPVTLGGRHGIGLRVGALATVGLPPIAQAMVDRGTGTRLGLDQVPATLLVAVSDDAQVGTVAARLEDALDVDATIVADPRAAAASSTGARPPQGDTVWDRLAQCESSGHWHVNTGNGYYGGLQFLPESWRLVGGTGMPHEASREEQIRRAELLLQRQGWIAWPVCSVVIGVRDP